MGDRFYFCQGCGVALEEYGTDRLCGFCEGMPEWRLQNAREAIAGWQDCVDAMTAPDAAGQMSEEVLAEVLAALLADQLVTRAVDQAGVPPEWGHLALEELPELVRLAECCDDCGDEYGARVLLEGGGTCQGCRWVADGRCYACGDGAPLGESHCTACVAQERADELGMEVGL
jgi:hypothetical protein